MTPLLQFRLWWKRGGAGERLAATLATAIVLALAAWVLVPTGSDDGGATNLQASAGATPGGGGAAAGAGAASATVADGARAGGATGGTATGGTATGGTATGGASGGSANAAGEPVAVGGGADAGAGANCPPTPSGAHGITDKTIALDIAVLDLAGPIGNGAVSQAPADDMQKIGQAVIADINARGGVACRSLTAKYYKVNPISPNSGQTACLQIIQDRPAVAVDAGGLVYGNAFDCLPQQKVPTVTVMNLLPSEVAKFAPYLASPAAELGTVMRTFATGLRDRGFFDPTKGFKKLGILEDECAPESNAIFEATLAKVGITSAQISKYSFACPANGFASPADMAQAASQHRLAGATHVVPLTGGGSFKAYSEAAQNQGFRPKYGITDYQGMPVTAASNLKPNPDNFDGALGISTGTYGMNTTPGAIVDPGTKRCTAIAAKAGYSANTVYQGAGTICGVLWTAEAALRHATALTPESILPGLFAAGPVQQAYSLADATFKAPSKWTGGDTWAPIEWHKGCSCWTILDGRHPSVMS